MVRCIITVLVFCCIAVAQPKIMPLELVEGADQLGCTQVNDFFEGRQGMVEPPYVYGFQGGDRQLSAVFWAKKKNTESNYLLIQMTRKNVLEKCKFIKLFETFKYPGGLSLVRDTSLSLDRFFPVEKASAVKVPLHTKATKLLVYNYYDNGGEYYYPYAGKWLVYYTR